MLLFSIFKSELLCGLILNKNLKKTTTKSKTLQVHLHYVITSAADSGEAFFEKRNFMSTDVYIFNKIKKK